VLGNFSYNSYLPYSTAFSSTGEAETLM